MNKSWSANTALLNLRFAESSLYLVHFSQDSFAVVVWSKSTRVRKNRLSIFIWALGGFLKTNPTPIWIKLVMDHGYCDIISNFPDSVRWTLMTLKLQMTLKPNEWNSLFCGSKWGGGGRGGWRVPRNGPHLGVKILSFSCIFRQKNCKIIGEHIHFGSWRPPPKENPGSATEPVTSKFTG